MSWVAVGIAAVSVGVSAYEYASAPGAPKPPDVTAASRAGVEAEAETEGDRRALQSAEQQGTSANYQVSKHKEKTDAVQLMQRVKLPNGKTELKPGKWVAYNAADWQPGGQYADSTKFAAGKRAQRNVLVQAHTGTADFTGLGEADVQSAEAKQNAANQLALQQKYGLAFVDAAKKQLAEADPQGTAARQKEYDLIEQQLNEKPDRPVAALLDKQVGDQLAAGNKLDATRQDILRQAIADSQNSRGQADDGSTDYEGNLETGQAGTARRLAAEQKALGWETSGATPEDVAYRREQQNDANLGAFVNGQTPQGQFKTLSGAGAGPAPYNPGQSLPQQNPGAGAAAQGFATSQYNTGLQYQLTQANPWTAGLSSLLSAASAAGKAGLQPFAG